MSVQYPKYLNHLHQTLQKYQKRQKYLNHQKTQRRQSTSKSKNQSTNKKYKKALINYLFQAQSKLLN